MIEQNMSNLAQRVKYLTQKRFGQSSEKVDDPNQLSIFEDTDNTSVFKQPETTGQQTETITYRRKKKSSRRVILSEDLPVEQEDLDLNDDEKVCLYCHAKMQRVGRRFVREQVCFIPAKLFKKETFQYTYRCSACVRHAEQPNQHYHSTNVPTPVIAHSIASPSLLAEVVHNKYELGVPRYRQIKDWRQLGVELSETTITNWMIKSAEWLMPLNELFRQRLMSQTHIHGDETTCQVLHEPNRNATAKSYLWLACSTSHAKEPIVYFHYDPHRSGAAAEKVYHGFKGKLQCDGYQAYDALTTIQIRSGCWAHSRRKFIETGPTVNTVKGQAKTALEMINQLFKIENELKSVSFQERLRIRQEESRPIVEKFFDWLNKCDVLSGSALGKAVNYARRQQTYLMQFLNDPEIDLSNNTAERHIKTAVIGRKNWMFSTSQKGAHTNALFLSLIETAKANGLVPRKYIEYLLERIPQLSVPSDFEQLKAYLPWTEEVQAECH